MNLLTDKTLIAFWEWYFQDEQLKSHKIHQRIDIWGSDIDNPILSKSKLKVDFLAKSEIEQYALYQEFFDSCGIHILPDYSLSLDEYFCEIIDAKEENVFTTKWHPSRPLAIQEAILASDGIFNSK